MNVEPPDELHTPYLDGSLDSTRFCNRRRLLQVMLTALMPRVAMAEDGSMCDRGALGMKRPSRRVCLTANSSRWHFNATSPGNIVEIGAVELNGLKLTGRKFHTYLSTDDEVEWAMFDEHGLSRESLIEAPRFAEVAAEFVCFIHGVELVVADEQDCNWVDAELSRLAMLPLKALCSSVTYTFDWYREIHSTQSPEIVRAGLRKLHNISHELPIQTTLEKARSLAWAYTQLHNIELARKHLVTI